MTEEIKEIFEINELFNEWKTFLSWCYENNDKTVEIHRDKIEYVMNYIIKLQKENEKLKMKNNMLRKDIDSFIKDNKIDYKQRNEKAIEYNKKIVEKYLKEDDCEYCDGRYNVAKKNLDILQGGDE